MTNQAFIAAARAWVGVPWVHQGRNRAGIDCVGLVVLSARACGLDVPLLADYSRRPDFARVKRELMRFGTRAGYLSEGSVIIYRSSSSCHMAIATDGDRVVQALSTAGRVVETRINFVPSQFWNFTWPS